MLIRRGWSLNLKRVRRLWNEMGLRRPLRLRKSRKLGPKPGGQRQQLHESAFSIYFKTIARRVLGACGIRDGGG